MQSRDNRGQFNNKVVTVDSTSYEDGTLYIRTGLRKMESGEMLTRFMLVEAVLVKRRWKVAEITFTHQGLAMSGRIAIAGWLKLRNIPAVATFEGGNTIRIIKQTTTKQ